MSKLREAAQKALGLMYGAKLCMLNSMSSRSEQQSLMGAAIDVLRAALAEPEQPNPDQARLLADIERYKTMLEVLERHVGRVERMAKREKELAAEPSGDTPSPVDEPIIDGYPLWSGLPPPPSRKPLPEPFNDVTQLQIAYIKGLGDAAPPSRKPEQEPHPDDLAVDAFAQAMKEKLALARYKGRGGWQTCPPDELSRMLRDHVEKGDPRDVANFCMFLWSIGHGIKGEREPTGKDGLQVECAPSAWVTMWPVPGGGHKPVFTEGSTPPNYGPELGAMLKFYPLFAAPPSRKPLTDEEVRKVVLSLDRDEWGFAMRVARAIEAAHGIQGEQE